MEEIKGLNAARYLRLYTTHEKIFKRVPNEEVPEGFLDGMDSTMVRHLTYVHAKVKEYDAIQKLYSQQNEELPPLIDNGPRD